MRESEFQEYLAFHRENPIGMWRDDFRIAQLASFVTTGPLKKPKNINDLMVFWNDSNESEQEAFDDLLKGAVTING